MWGLRTTIRHCTVLFCPTDGRTYAKEVARRIADLGISVRLADGISGAVRSEQSRQPEILVFIGTPHACRSATIDVVRGAAARNACLFLIIVGESSEPPDLGVAVTWHRESATWLEHGPSDRLVDAFDKRYGSYHSHPAAPRMIAAPRPLVFISYAHDDHAFRSEFRRVLSDRAPRRRIAAWDDSALLPGSEWRREISRQLDAASVFVLLVTDGFLRSVYCRDVELKRALDRRYSERALILPVLVRKCAALPQKLLQLQCLPMGDDGRLKAVADWQPRERAWAQVIEAIELRNPGNL